MYKKASNTGAFKNLSEPMQKKHVRNIVKKYNIDLKGLHLKIEYDEAMIGIGYAGLANPKYADKGRIHLYPRRFCMRKRTSENAIPRKNTFLSI
jgi:hypothetical protein